MGSRVAENRLFAMGQKSQLHVSYTWDGIAVSIENSCNAVEKNGALRFFICILYDICDLLVENLSLRSPAVPSVCHNLVVGNLTRMRCDIGKSYVLDDG